MNVSDLLTPWLALMAVLVPLVYIEKWIHSHLYGVGWLLTNDNKSATILYYILLAPGVLLHEIVQWLVAGAINVDTKRIKVWPEPQKDGTLRLDFVQIKDTNRISAAIIGGAPLIVGLALIWVISNYVLNLDNLLEALTRGNLPTISAVIQDLATTPDFYLWIYLLFAISNAMLPTPADRQGWPLIFMAFAGVIVFLIVIGTGDQLLETYEESVVTGLERLSTAFGTVLVTEIPAMVMIGFGEEILERTTKRKFLYTIPVESKAREPGSSEPLPPGAPRPSIYLLDLPIPLPPDKPKPRPAASTASSSTLQRQEPIRVPTSTEASTRATERTQPDTARSPDTTTLRSTEETRAAQPPIRSNRERSTPPIPREDATRDTAYDASQRYRRPDASSPHTSTPPPTARPDSASTRAEQDGRARPSQQRPPSRGVQSSRTTPSGSTPRPATTSRPPADSPREQPPRYGKPLRRPDADGKVSNDQPARNRGTEDTAPRVPNARPTFRTTPRSDEEQTEKESPERRLRRPGHTGIPQRSSRPSRLTPPPPVTVSDDVDDDMENGDDVEYIPFDDVDIPDDDF